MLYKPRFTQSLALSDCPGAAAGPEKVPWGQDSCTQGFIEGGGVEVVGGCCLSEDPWGCPGEGELRRRPGMASQAFPWAGPTWRQPTHSLPSSSSLCELLKYLLSLGTGWAGLGGKGVTEAPRSGPVICPPLQAVLS